MKVLEVSSLHQGIQQLIDCIEKQYTEMNGVLAAVNELISLEDAFKGEGGKAIRTFYEECHKEFIEFYQQFLKNFEQVLSDLTQGLATFEPSENGFISESFLTHELDHGLKKTKSITTDLTDEANDIINSVSDIVSLPHLDDHLYLQAVDTAMKEKEETIQRLYEFDHKYTKSFEQLEQDVETMNRFIDRISDLFQSGNLSITDYKPHQLFTDHFIGLGVGDIGGFQAGDTNSVTYAADGYTVVRDVRTGGMDAETTSTVLDFVPLVSNIKSILEVLSGKDSITGRNLTGFERILVGIGIVGGPVTKGASKVGKWVVKGLSNYSGEVLKGLAKIKNVLNPDKVKKIAKDIYESTVQPFFKNIKNKIKDVVKSIGNTTIPNSVVPASGPNIGRSIGDVVEDAKDALVSMANKVKDQVGQGSKGIDNGNKYWNKTTQFKNVKVYQRDDIINPNMKDARGRTNLERMEKGLAPLGPDGKSINLHHMTQRNESSIAEVTQTFHKDNSSVIHINPNTIPSGINRSEFNKWRTDYWKNRANDF